MTHSTITPAQSEDLAPQNNLTEDIALLRQAAAGSRLRIRCRDRAEGDNLDAGMVWPIELELPCINGLSCWFTIGNLYTPDAAARGYTDGALNDELAHGFAAHIVRSLSSLPEDLNALAKLAEIPPAGSEERERWLEAAWRQVFAVHKGFLCTNAMGFLALMSEARRQGQRDVLESGGSDHTTASTPRGGDETLGATLAGQATQQSDEVWLPISGYETAYEVSSLGRVRSKDRVTDEPVPRALVGKVLSPVPDSDGYPTVRLSLKGISTRFKVHRLVCTAFLGEPLPGLEAAHLDGDVSNARADNLIWATHAENEAHKLQHRTRARGASHGQSRLSEVDVREIRRRVAAGESRGLIQSEYGISSGHVSDIVNGRLWPSLEEEAAVSALAGECPSRGPAAIARRIIYFGQPGVVICDARCDKAWGINNRPQVQTGEDDDDFAYLADGELGEAPADPGTYEGGCAKPVEPSDRLNKWCVRECERSSLSRTGRGDEVVEARDFSRRSYNQPWKHAAALGTEARSAETGTGSVEDEGPADLSATPEAPPSLSPDPITAARAVLEELDPRFTYQAHIAVLRKWAARPDQADEDRADYAQRADAIEAALSTIQSHQEKTGEVRS